MKEKKKKFLGCCCFQKKFKDRKSGDKTYLRKKERTSKGKTDKNDF